MIKIVNEILLKILKVFKILKKLKDKYKYTCRFFVFARMLCFTYFLSDISNIYIIHMCLFCDVIYKQLAKGFKSFM